MPPCHPSDTARDPPSAHPEGLARISRIISGVRHIALSHVRGPPNIQLRFKAITKAAKSFRSAAIVPMASLGVGRGLPPPARPPVRPWPHGGASPQNQPCCPRRTDLPLLHPAHPDKPDDVSSPKAAGQPSAGFGLVGSPLPTPSQSRPDRTVALINAPGPIPSGPIAILHRAEYLSEQDGAVKPFIPIWLLGDMIMIRQPV